MLRRTWGTMSAALAGGFVLVGLSASCVDRVDRGRATNETEGGGPPIEISYEVPEAIGAGQEGEIVISFTILADADDIELRLAAGKGLGLVSAGDNWSYGTQAAGSSFSRTVRVRPEEEGIAYLSVFVSGSFEDQQLTEAETVPIRTGPDATRSGLEPPGRVRRDGEGRRVIEVPLTKDGE